MVSAIDLCIFHLLLFTFDLFYFFFLLISSNSKYFKNYFSFNNKNKITRILCYFCFIFNKKINKKIHYYTNFKQSMSLSNNRKLLPSITKNIDDFFNSTSTTSSQFFHTQPVFVIQTLCFTLTRVYHCTI
jgi:hypothetical protein